MNKKEQVFRDLKALSELKDGEEYEISMYIDEEAKIILEELDKYKEVLDKIKEIFKDYGVKEDIVDYSNYYISGESLIHILELLEEIE